MCLSTFKGPGCWIFTASIYLLIYLLDTGSIFTYWIENRILNYIGKMVDISLA